MKVLSYEDNSATSPELNGNELASSFQFSSVAATSARLSKMTYTAQAESDDTGAQNSTTQAIAAVTRWRHGILGSRRRGRIVSRCKAAAALRTDSYSCNSGKTESMSRGSRAPVQKERSRNSVQTASK